MRYIKKAAYRHLMAYIRIEGLTQMEALRNAKKVGTFLKDQLPDAQHFIPRPKGENADGVFVYEVPVGVAMCSKKAKVVLSKMVLKGSV